MIIVSLLIAVLALTILAQTVTDILKQLIPIEKIGPIPLPQLLALIVGVVVAVVTRTDILAAIGFSVHSELAGWIITGIVISGGASTVHELVAKLRESRSSI